MTDCPQPENPQKKADSPQVRRGVQISTRAVLLPATGSRMPGDSAGNAVTHAESRSFPASLMPRRCRTRTAKQKSAPEVRPVPVLKP
ncbi:hypothetical protein Dde_2653 [Oleidesulfovibrio alaskensis G20]|jgi:hypothetical protein|uniref:Uncharacterized protein n=1 Tax=Oleidesulfovibrio alaskensis (strain ATCC BAA-1058 / DSM 17464 / G20) TaxID=207559 RepID=Q30XZ7_OLEA2|nr:hypothetical protein Dde_2653 [Oleidesulfovibrio alaskensis G20]